MAVDPLPFLKPKITAGALDRSGGFFSEAAVTRDRDYFNEELIEVNLVLSLVPRPLTTAMIARLMPAAIRPYSMAVAPVSSARNARMIFCMIEHYAKNIKSG